MDDEKRTPSPEEQAKKAERRKILERLNTMDTGVSRYDMEQEEQRARGIDMEVELAREGTTVGGICLKARQLLGPRTWLPRTSTPELPRIR